MSISKSLQNQAVECLKATQNLENTSELEQKLSELLPDIDPKNKPKIYPSLDSAEQNEPAYVYVDLMIQDIRDQQFYYSYLVSKPITQDSIIHSLKYGMQAGLSEEILEGIENDKYHSIIDSRETLICVSEKYRSPWVNNWSHQATISKPVEMFVPAKHQFKLGQQIQAICIWHPSQSKLHFVRNANKQEILENNLNFEMFALNQQIDYSAIRYKLVSQLNLVLPQNFSLLLIYSLISQQSVFIDGPNIFEIVEALYPRVFNFKVKAPFSQSFFPYKNEENHLVNTALQLSLGKTFIIIDFSELSNETQTKIAQAEIDNLKALKIFVEDGQAVYRWQYGESLFSHNHSGIICKASSILNPHYKLELEFSAKYENPFLQVAQKNLEDFRVYLQKCRAFQPLLTEHERMKIELLLKEESQSFPQRKLQIPQRLELSRLNAMSYGRQEITNEDYLVAKKILLNQ